MINFCKICQAECGDMIDLETHMIQSHNTKPVLTCKKCKEQLIGVDEFDKHLTFVHNTTHWNLNLALRYVKRLLERFYDAEM